MRIRYTDTGEPGADPAIAEAAALIAKAKRPLILAGGGAKRSESMLVRLAETIDAPVMTTANGRGLLHGHVLAVHAGPSLKAVRALIDAEYALNEGGGVVLGVAGGREPGSEQAKDGGEQRDSHGRDYSEAGARGQ